MTEQITARQRNVQRDKIGTAIKLLEVAAIETKTATPAEISGTVDVALEIVAKVNEFLKSRPEEKEEIEEENCPHCNGTDISPYERDGGSCPHCFGGYVK